MRKDKMLSCVLMMTVGSPILFSCSLRWLAKPSWESPRVVSVEGAEEWVSFLQGIPLGYRLVKNGQATHLLVRGGDLLWSLSPNGVFVYLDSDGPSLSIKYDEHRTELNGKTVSLMLGNSDGWEWLEKASPEDLSALRLIEIREEIDSKRMASLKRLFQVNPHVGLWIGSNVTLQGVLPLADPDWLLLPRDRLGEEELAILTKKRNVRTLIILGEMGDLSFLSKLPNLDTLWIAGWDPSIAGRFPEKLNNLRRLILSDSRVKNFSSLGKQPHLDVLRLEGGENCPIDSLDGISNFPALKELGISLGENLKDLSPLKQLRQLKWLSTFTGTQEQLESIVRDHPNLVGLELFTTSKVTDLSALKELRNLKYLLVMTPNAELDPILAMKGLRWLAVSSEDKETAVRIQKALPDTSVVRATTPLCLGSGWILLLGPGALVACWIEIRRRKAVQMGYGCDGG